MQTFQRGLEIIPFNIWHFHRCSSENVKAAPWSPVGAYCKVAWVAPVRTRPKTLAVTYTRNLLALSREQHMTVRPEGITVCIVLISQLQTATKASPTLQLLCSSPKGGKCCYSMMIKGDQCLPGSWHFQYLAAATVLALHALLNVSSFEGVTVPNGAVGTQVSDQRKKLISLIGSVCMCVCCSMVFTAVVFLQSNHGHALVLFCFTYPWM